MAYGTRIAWDAIREKDASSITGSYTTLGTALADNARLLGISNSAAQEIYISFDGSTNHLRLSGNSFKVFDISTNKIRDDGLFIPVGTQLYVKWVGTTTMTGAVWAEVAYAEGGK